MQHTLNFKYRCNDNGFYDFLKTLRQQYTICVHYLINRLMDSDGALSEKDLRDYQTKIENIDMIDSWTFQCAVKEAIQNYKSFKQHYDEHEKERESKLKELEFKHSTHKITDHKYAVKKQKIMESLTLVFGGKDNLAKRQKGQITREEFKENRLRDFYTIGEASNKGNRKMKINNDLSLTFKYNKDMHFDFELLFNDNKHRNMMLELFQAANDKLLSVSFRFDDKKIHVSYESDIIAPPIQSEQINNRVLAMDLNPNYIGWSIVDWKSSSEFNVIENGVFDLKKLSDIYKELNDLGCVKSDDPRRVKLNHKKNYETILIGKNLIDKALYYKCQICSIEDLNIKQCDKNKGKDYNALCNNHWLRTVLTYQLEKKCNIHKIKLLKVKPQYSSFIGNVLFRHLEGDMPDMVLASIEIGRRGYEFYNQYVIKSKEIRKNIIQPDIKDFENFWKMSLEILELKPEVEKSEINTLIKLYNFIKTREGVSKYENSTFLHKVRVTFSPKERFRFFSHKSMVFTS